MATGEASGDLLGGAGFHLHRVDVIALLVAVDCFRAKATFALSRDQVSEWSSKPRGAWLSWSGSPRPSERIALVAVRP